MFKKEKRGLNKEVNILTKSSGLEVFDYQGSGVGCYYVQLQLFKNHLVCMYVLHFPSWKLHEFGTWLKDHRKKGQRWYLCQCL